jgi:hypothetical protein
MDRMAGPRFLARAVAVAAIVASSAACAQPGAESQGGVPPPPRTPDQNLGSNSPPVVWLGGSLVSVTPDRIGLRQADGSDAKLQRLAGSATRFLRVEGDAWKAFVPAGGEAVGHPACIETLMDGSNLVAIRVFLDSGCGPI